MNWKRLYSLSTPEERLETIIQMMQTVEARQQKIILAGSRIIRNRRGTFAGAHFIRDRRGQHQARRILYRWAFIFILLTLSIGTWLFTFHAPASIGAPVMATHLAALMAFLLIKPYNRQTHLARARA